MRWLRRILAGVAIGLVAAVLAGWLWLRGTLPQVDGTIEVAGIGAEVEIRRDAEGVPHITAASEADAYFGLGFVHAQDRLWQMELTRRGGRGRLAEVFGAPALRHDRHFRALGLARIAERNLAAADSETRALLAAYAAGVNAHIESHRGPYGIEFALLRLAPEAWTAADPIIAVKMMVAQLAGNAGAELLRAKLLKRLSHSQVETLWPPYPGEFARLAPAYAEIDEGLIDAALAALPPVPDGVASNNWAVAARRSATGAPILANDPHLPLSVPAPWYLAHLVAPSLNVAGGTLAGIPAFVVGCTESAAWGVTHTGADVQDLVVVGDDDVVSERREVMAVRNEEPAEMVVRETAFGPIVSDGSALYAAIKGERAIALSWTALAPDDTTMQAGFALARAESVDELLAALRDFHSPEESFVLADAQGAIAFVAAGRVPVRAGHDGWLPVEAANGAWTGFISFEQLPHTRDPASGVLFTANQKIVAADYPHFLTREWHAPYRALRLAELLDSRERFAVADFAAMQIDRISPMAQDFLPLLLAAPLSPRGERVRPLLEAWDASMDAARPEPLLFQAWYRALVARLLADELGTDFARYYHRRPLAMRRILTADGAWCDDLATPEAETCDAQIAAALDDALDWLEARYGEQSKWRWGDAHVAVSRHAVFSTLPLLRDLFEIRRAHDGGPYTVMQANTRIDDEEAPFAEIHGASLRAIFDLADPDGARVMLHTGQSGHRLSRHYDDLADRWVAGETFALPLTRAAVEARATHRLVLVPKP